MKKTMKSLALWMCIAALTAVGCRQLRELKALSKCQFRMTTIQDIRLADVNVQSISKLTQLKITDITRLGQAFLSGKLPLTFTLNTQARNPNKQLAAINKLAWTIDIDDIRMSAGTITRRIEVPAEGGIADIPIAFSADLKEILSGRSKDAVLNFGMNLAGAGNYPSRVALRIKPSVMIGKKNISWPGYFRVQKEFTSGDAK